MDRCFRILEFVEPQDETGTKVTALANDASYPSTFASWTTERRLSA